MAKSLTEESILEFFREIPPNQLGLWRVSDLYEWLGLGEAHLPSYEKAKVADDWQRYERYWAYRPHGSLSKLFVEWAKTIFAPFINTVSFEWANVTKDDAGVVILVAPKIIRKEVIRKEVIQDKFDSKPYKIACFFCDEVKPGYRIGKLELCTDCLDKLAEEWGYARKLGKGKL